METSKPEEKKYRYLYDSIEKTRKARIQAEKRLLSWDALARHASVYYACWTTVLSVALIVIPTDVYLSAIALAMATVTTMCTIYASSQNYGVRALQMRYSYLAMQKLLFDMDSQKALGIENSVKIADEVGDKYNAILHQTENHTTSDYTLSVYRANNSSSISGNKTKTQFFNCAHIKLILFRLAVYGSPLVVLAVYTIAKHMVW